MRACRVRRRSGWRQSWMGDDLKRLVEAGVASGESYQMELGAERLRFNDGTGGDRWPSPGLKLICMSPAGSGSTHVVFVWGKKKTKSIEKKKNECFRRVNEEWATFLMKSLLMWVTRQEKQLIIGLIFLLELVRYGTQSVEIPWGFRHVFHH